MSKASIVLIALMMLTVDSAATIAFGQRVKKDARAVKSVSVDIQHISKDRSVKLDYDIVYIRAPRRGDDVGTNWAEVSSPLFMDAGADLVLLHPDGNEEVLVAGGKGSVTDPMVSFDGEWVYYALFHDLQGATVTEAPPTGADIYKIHVKTRRIVRLTHQRFTPNTGAGNWSRDFRTPEPGKNLIEYGVFNTGPCPLPGNKVVFTSNRNAFRPPKRLTQTMQLFVMDDDGSNVECIGHLNLGTALHPVVLMDGRVIFSSLESQGLRTSTLWGLWSIHPDGTDWGPVLSAFLPGESPNAFHFQTQLSDGSIVAEEYYNQTSSGFGGFVKLPLPDPNGGPAFGPGHLTDPRNPALRGGRLEEGQPRTRRLPFSPRGIEALTPFARTDEGPADFAFQGERYGTRVGKVTHPSAAPDHHLLTVWSPGPVNGGYTVHVPAVDSGLYLLKGGRPIDEPGKLLLIKNDTRYNEQWPRALVPYRRVYGITQPKSLPRSANDGRQSPSLPEGTPFGLIGTSSLYKRESYPNGGVLAGRVTAAFVGTDRTGGFQGLDPFNSSEGAVSLNWTNQGADAGRYSNDDIHAIRILVMEPTTDRQRGPKSGRTFRSHANERLRILGEVPVRKFPPASAAIGHQDEEHQGGQPADPDGNPDTSFLARIPADVAFTFQTLDKYGMVLNMAQTWHQLRPGEVRHDCGGCHAHSQKPTLFRDTWAARPDYRIFDLTESTPLVTTRANDRSGRRWDREGLAGLRHEKAVKNVEYYRDVKPILDRSCAACHTQSGSEPPAGELVLDDNKMVDLPDADDVPGTYYRLATDFAGRFGRPPLIGSWRNANASRYVRMFQSRRSLLIWKVFGRRTDGWTNDDFPTETVAGDPQTLQQNGKAVPNTRANRNRADVDFTGSIMPPPAAVAGEYDGPGGKKIQVAGLSDEDRLTLVRWIDLGCPIDLDFNPDRPEATGFGWMLDDQRPTLTLTSPHSGDNPPLTRLLIGMYDYGGLALDSLQVFASFPIDGLAPGGNLARSFKSVSQGVWKLKIERPISLASGKVTVSVEDRQGNETRIERTFTAGRHEVR